MGTLRNGAGNYLPYPDRAIFRSSGQWRGGGGGVPEAPLSNSENIKATAMKL